MLSVKKTLIRAACGMYLITLLNHSALPQSKENTSASQGNVSLALDKIKNEDAALQRTEYARQLLLIIKMTPKETIDDRVIEEIATLLQDQYDSVRLWVAASLGEIGPRATSAVPALEKALKEIECQPGGLTSEPAIRLALTRIGKDPSPQSQCPLE